MPGLSARGEVAAMTFGSTIDGIGHVFANEALLDEIVDSSDLATLVAERTRYLWPDSYDLRRIPVRDPTQIHPMSLIWRDDNRHPALIEFREYLSSRRAGAPNAW